MKEFVYVRCEILAEGEALEENPRRGDAALSQGKR